MKLLFQLSKVVTLALTVFAFSPEHTKTNLTYEGANFSPQLIKKLPKMDRPDLAGLHDFEMTKDLSLGYPPTERKLVAYEELKSRKTRTRNDYRAIPNTTWQERGPNNVGGRTRAIMYDPTDPSGRRVFAGGVSGGLWVNENIEDANSKWENKDDFMASLAVSSIAFDPSNPSIFYLATGEGWSHEGLMRGNGIWKSTDAGNSWKHLASTQGPDFTFVQRIAVTAQGHVVAATNTGLRVSTNGGQSWEVKVPGRAADIAIASNGTIYISIGVFSPGRIHRSTDNGLSFQELSGYPANGQRIELAASESNPQVLYAIASNNGNIAWFRKTTDGGATWTALAVPRYLNQNCTTSAQDFGRGQAWYNLAMAVHPENENMVILGGIDLFKSHDGGQSWNPISYWTGLCRTYVHADQHAIVFHPSNFNEALIGNDGGVYRSANLGETATTPSFEVRNNGYNITQFYSVAVANVAGSNYFLGGTQDNGTQQFQQMGTNSTRMVTGGDGGFCFIDEENPEIQISSYVYNSYWRSTNHGAFFVNRFVDESTQGTGRFINPADYDSKSKTLYAARNNNEMARYSNMAGLRVVNQVVPVAIGNRRLTHVKINPHLPNSLIVGNDIGQLYKITEAHATPQVTRIDNGTLPPGYISSVDIGASDQQILVTLSNYGVNSVWETHDGGTTWLNKEGNLPDIPVRWGLYNPLNRQQVMLATELGIWTTDNVSVSYPDWEPTVDGLANVRCDMLRYRPADGLVAVATHGRGLFTTDVFAHSFRADFTVDRTLTYTDQTLYFSDLSFGTEKSWLWDFGDGNISTVQNPKHQYAQAGTYHVTLTIREGAAVEQKENLIKVLPMKGVDYTAAHGGNFENHLSDFAALTKNGTSFELGQSIFPGKSGTASGQNAWVTGLHGRYAPRTEAYLYSPVFEINQAGTYEVSFWANYQLETENETTGWDGFVVEYTHDFGASWTKLGNEIAENWYGHKAHSHNIAFKSGEAMFSGNTHDSFQEKSTELTISSKHTHVAFRFVFKSDANGELAGLALDNFTFVLKDTDGPLMARIHTENPDCATQELVIESRSIGYHTSAKWEFGPDADTPTLDGNGPHTVKFTTNGVKEIKLVVTDGTHTHQTSRTIYWTKAAISKVNSYELQATPGETFQWYKNGTTLSGANGRVLDISQNTKNDFFTVAVTQNGCTAHSAPFKTEEEITINTYPNPTHNIMKIEASDRGETVQLNRVLDWNGRELHIPVTQTFAGLQIDLSNEPKGYYFLEVATTAGMVIKKIRKD
jgi:PKD repeat protein/photosystem II stability/assembly factor-like uncharacterized protein